MYNDTVHFGEEKYAFLSAKEKESTVTLAPLVKTNIGRLRLNKYI
jgi:hypothetical protein